MKKFLQELLRSSMRFRKKKVEWITKIWMYSNTWRNFWRTPVKRKTLDVIWKNLQILVKQSPCNLWTFERISGGSPGLLEEFLERSQRNTPGGYLIIFLEEFFRKCLQKKNINKNMHELLALYCCKTTDILQESSLHKNF